MLLSLKIEKMEREPRNARSTDLEAEKHKEMNFSLQTPKGAWLH